MTEREGRISQASSEVAPRGESKYVGSVGKHCSEIVICSLRRRRQEAYASSSEVQGLGQRDRFRKGRGRDKIT